MQIVEAQMSGFVIIYHERGIHCKKDVCFCVSLFRVMTKNNLKCFINGDMLSLFTLLIQLDIPYSSARNSKITELGRQSGSTMINKGVCLT